MVKVAGWKLRSFTLDSGHPLWDMAQMGRQPYTWLVSSPRTDRIYEGLLMATLDSPASVHRASDGTLLTGKQEGATDGPPSQNALQSPERKLPFPPAGTAFPSLVIWQPPPGSWTHSSDLPCCPPSQSCFLSLHITQLFAGRGLEPELTVGD